jgi:hypothetical protein
MGDIQFTCPHCNQLLKVPDTVINQVIQCPVCNKQTTLPKPPALTPPHEVLIAAPATVPAVNHDPNACPLCGKSKHMHDVRLLYDHIVCKKCYYGFANLRQLAFIIDILSWYGFCFCVGIALGIVMVMSGFSEKDIDHAGNILSWIILPVFLFKECFSGYSLGKLICGVRIIDNTSGKPTGIGASIMRTLPLLIPFMPLIVAYQLCKGHRIGDGWSNTKVIWNKYAFHPTFKADRASA